MKIYENFFSPRRQEQDNAQSEHVSDEEGIDSVKDQLE